MPKNKTSVTLQSAVVVLLLLLSFNNRCADAACSATNSDGTCASCANPTTQFGPYCQPCPCLRGTCRSGITGDGLCSACTALSYGPYCDRSFRQPTGLLDGTQSACCCVLIAMLILAWWEHAISWARRTAERRAAKKLDAAGQENDDNNSGTVASSESSEPSEASDRDESKWSDRDDVPRIIASSHLSISPRSPPPQPGAREGSMSNVAAASGYADRRATHSVMPVDLVDGTASLWAQLRRQSSITSPDAGPPKAHRGPSPASAAESSVSRGIGPKRSSISLSPQQSSLSPQQFSSHCVAATPSNQQPQDTAGGADANNSSCKGVRQLSTPSQPLSCERELNTFAIAAANDPTSPTIRGNNSPLLHNGVESVECDAPRDEAAPPSAALVLPKFRRGDRVRRNGIREGVVCDFGGVVGEVLCGEYATIRSVTVQRDATLEVVSFAYTVDHGDTDALGDIEELFDLATMSDASVLSSMASEDSINE